MIPHPGRRVAYVTPFSMPTNLYIEMQKELARQSGYEVRPFSMKHLFLQGGLLGLMRRRNLVLVQWLETRPFKMHGAHCGLSAAGLLLFFTSLFLLAVCPATVAFFVHDHAVNDTEGALKALSQWFMFTLRRVADFRVVHDPGCQKMYDATYLPHPLYWDRPGAVTEARAAASARVPHVDGAPLRCAMLGAIRVYKSIDSVLRVWPASQPLLVAGRGAPDLAAELEAIVKQRSLQDVVSIDPTHQSDEAFDKHLGATDVLILPHASDTALVSGAFFETIGRVPFIVARRSRFMEWAASEFEGVYVFDRPEELPALLRRLDRNQVEVSADTVARAKAAFGHDSCHRLWGAFFQSMARVELQQGRRPSALRR